MEQFSKYELAAAYKAAQIQAPLPDVVLTLGDYSWKVHGELLTTKSQFFQGALKGSFKVSVLQWLQQKVTNLTQEAVTKSIILHDDDPWAVARLLLWLYDGRHHASQAN